jgi:hypothetical protein
MDGPARSVSVSAPMANSTPVACEPGQELYVTVLVVYEVNSLLAGGYDRTGCRRLDAREDGLRPRFPAIFGPPPGACRAIPLAQQSRPARRPHPVTGPVHHALLTKVPHGWVIWTPECSSGSGPIMSRHAHWAMTLLSTSPFKSGHMPSLNASNLSLDRLYPGRLLGERASAATGRPLVWLLSGLRVSAPAGDWTYRPGRCPGCRGRPATRH